MIKIKSMILIMLSISLMGIGIAHAETTVIDPMAIGVGARPLGMGKAYAAVAENGDAIFTNPAGLAKTDSFTLTSMYANLLGDVNYTVVSTAFPINDKLTIGAGGIFSSVSDIPLYSESAESLGMGKFSKSVLFLSCGIDLGKIKIGTNLKSFNQAGSGSEYIKDADGSGYNMDIGILYNVNSRLSFGVNQQNILDNKMKFDTGREEKIETQTKLGAKISILKQLILAVDADLTQYGTALHVGAEYCPLKFISLRAGLDQDQNIAEPVSNLTMGVGIKFNGIEFDYAYHPYSDIPENTTHYFSISYLSEKQ